jgi:hypothetical protein
MKIHVVVFGLSVLALFGCSAARLLGCSGDRREIARSSSPDHVLLAVHIEAMGGGAAGFVSEEIYINEQSNSADRKHPILIASHCEVLSLGWLDDRTLQVHYSVPCSINQFTNRWYVPSELAQGSATPVEIILVRDTPKPS